MLVEAGNFGEHFCKDWTYGVHRDDIHRTMSNDERVFGLGDVSLMPEGYEKILTPHEIADIVAYLKADVSRPAGSSQPTGE